MMIGLSLDSLFKFAIINIWLTANTASNLKHGSVIWTFNGSQVVHK